MRTRVWFLRRHVSYIKEKLEISEWLIRRLKDLPNFDESLSQPARLRSSRVKKTPARKKDPQPTTMVN